MRSPMRWATQYAGNLKEKLAEKYGSDLRRGIAPMCNVSKAF
jgi:hypothetical protein